MSKENVKGYHFVTNENNVEVAKQFCKKHDLFSKNGWDAVGCAYGININVICWSIFAKRFNPNDIENSKLITFEEFKTLFLNNNNYEIY